MLIVVSPAKSLDYETPLPTRKHSEPRLLDQAEQLVGVMAGKGPDELEQLMGISRPLAELNFERYQDGERPFTADNARPAVVAFTGDVYQGLDVRGTFSERDYTHAQKVLRILSGLYGVLRPLDLMQPYRLEMGTRLTTDRGDSLYQWWGDTITDVLNEDLAASPGTPALVNLASNEYFGAVDEDAINGTVVTPTFLDRPAKGGEPRIISFNAKRARGAMAGWIIRHRITSMKALNDFDELGYRFDPNRSSRHRPVFVNGG